MKLAWQPSLRTVQRLNFVCAAFSIGCAILVINPWVALLNAFLAGFNLAFAVSAHFSIANRENFDRVRAAFDEMAYLNEKLLAEKIQFAVDKDESIDRPSLH